MKCYVAGPMTGISEFNFPAFDSLANHMRANGWDAVNPAERDRELYDTTTAGFAEGDVKLWSETSGFDFHQAMRFDLGVITTCDAVVFLPGWERSSGAAKERRVAEDCGVTLLYAVMTSVGWYTTEDNPNAPVLVGITGYAQAGKDTAASVLIDRYGFERVSFADALRDMLYALNPLARRRHDNVYVETVATVQEWVNAHGWEWAKANTEVRVLLQNLGTEAGRNVLGDDIWVRTAMARVGPGGRYVFTDVRFPNEADAVESAGGQLWRIERDGTAPVNAHPSETALDGRKVVERIHNTGDDPDGFHRLVDSIAFHKLGLQPVTYND